MGQDFSDLQYDEGERIRGRSTELEKGVRTEAGRTGPGDAGKPTLISVSGY